MHFYYQASLQQQVHKPIIIQPSAMTNYKKDGIMGRLNHKHLLSKGPGYEPIKLQCLRL
jgi:hypothetical protein